ncbi:Terminal uridylyltransferase 4 [Halotydeus destructor]|nr:Terminal uridylyltransferase 4 [Halotydeus destructor]
MRPEYPVLADYIAKPQYDESLFVYSAVNHNRLVQELCQAATFSSLVDYLMSTVLLSPLEIEKRQQLVDILTLSLEKYNMIGTFSIFGSSANSLGFKDSDLDMYFQLNVAKDDNKKNSKLDREEVIKELTRMKNVLEKTLDMKIWKPVRAKVPIIQLDFELNRLPRNRNLKCGLKCDISLTSNHGVCHSRLLCHFSIAEPLFRQLAVLIKYWMKRSNLISPHRITSFASVLMTVFYLQSRDLLPSVRSIQSSPSSEDNPVYDFQNVTSSNSTQPKPTLAELFLDYFQFYHDFDFKKLVICPHFGYAIPKESLEKLNPTFATPCDKISVQDTFDLKRNQSQNMSETFFSEFTGTLGFLIKVSHDLQQQYPKDEAAKHLFTKLIHTAVVVPSRSARNRVPKLSLASVSEWRRPRVLAEWKSRCPLITRVILCDILDFEYTEEDFMMDASCSGTLCEYDCAIHCICVLMKRAEIKKDLEVFLRPKKFIEKEVYLSYHIRTTPEYHETCYHPSGRSIRFQLEMNPDPESTLMKINFIEPKREDAELVATLRSYLFLFYSKYFNANDELLKNDLKLFNVDLNEI